MMNYIYFCKIIDTNEKYTFTCNAFLEPGIVVTDSIGRECVIEDFIADFSAISAEELYYQNQISRCFA